MNQNNPILAMQLFEEPSNNSDFLKMIAAQAVMVRADYLEDSSLKRVSLSNGFKIYSLCSKKHGGRFEGSFSERISKLIEALEFYELVELEYETDLTPEILRLIPPEKRMISWCGECDDYGSLESVYQDVAGYEAQFHKIVHKPRDMKECLWSMRLISNHRNDKLICYSEGAKGVWTQILSAYLGSRMVLGRIGITDSEVAYLKHDQLENEYGLPRIREVKDIYGIAGNPVFASLSPLIHNKSYEEVGMKALYLPFHIEEFNDFWSLISDESVHDHLGIQFRGFTMVSPFKEETYRSAAKHLSVPTWASRASNILVKREGIWCSDSSDGMGVVAELEKRKMDIRNLNISIIGCGGAGRTIAARLKVHGSKVTMYNRSWNRGEFASDLLGLPFELLSNFDASKYDVVINATPVGKYGKKLIYDPSKLGDQSLAIDMAYTKADTLLVEGCRRNGKQIVEGKQILLHQVKKQFSGLTGVSFPESVEPLVKEKTANVL